ncbi:MAG TPA: hypothetical protein VM010_06590 [Chitinophagaceae bacterium]|nr:hypothetical protein [Chitinophagaceae bacterium]
MTRIYSKWFPGILIVMVLVACSKHAGDVEAPVATALLTHTSPTEGAAYKTGDSVWIKGLAIAPHEIHGYELSIRSATDTSVVYYSEHIHDHNDTITINQKWKNTLATPAHLQAGVTLILDHDGNTATKTAAFITTGN